MKKRLSVIESTEKNAEDEETNKKLKYMKKRLSMVEDHSSDEEEERDLGGDLGKVKVFKVTT